MAKKAHSAFGSGIIQNTDKKDRKLVTLADKIINFAKTELDRFVDFDDVHPAFLQTKVKIMNKQSCSSSSSSSSPSSSKPAKVSSNVSSASCDLAKLCGPAKGSSSNSSSGSSSGSVPSSCIEALGPSAFGSSGGTATPLACPPDSKNTNVVGKTGNLNFKITKAPYVLKSCDQVIYIEGATTFIEPDDYKNRKPQIYTMSAYSINQFVTVTPEMNLKRQILLDDITSMPVEIPGAPRCLKFSAAESDIIMCLNQNQKANQLMKAYQDLLKCRLGGDINDDRDKQPMLLFKKFQLACMKKKQDGAPNVQEANYLKSLDPSLPNLMRQQSFKLNNFNPAFGYKTPGAE